MSKDEGEQNSDLSTKALDTMRRIRTALILEHPFFGSLALRMRLGCDNSCADFWSNGRELVCNPVYAASLSEEKLKSAMAHEVLHIALGHHVRRKDRNEQIWNKACDYAVNAILQESGFFLPEGALFRPEYVGKSVDDIYIWLSHFSDDTSHNASLDTENGEDSASLDGMGSKKLGSEGQRNEGHAGNSEESNKNSDRMDKKGGKPGDNRSGQEQYAEHSFRGEVRDHPLIHESGGDEAQLRAEQDADIALVQASREAMNMGNMPAGLTRLIRERLRPILDWKELLSRFIEQCMDNDYSWTHPDRRYIHQNIYLPSRREFRLPEIVLAVDCSGSIDTHTLNRFCEELSGILDSYDTRLTVMYHDMIVQGYAVYTRQDMPLVLTPMGGGGTDYRPVPETIESMGIDPACLLWFTDLECDRFPPEPCWPVLWICSSRKKKREVPFGELIVLPEKGDVYAD